MDRNDFCTHPLRFCVSILTVAASVILGITFLVIGRPAGTLVLAVIAGLFVWQALWFTRPVSPYESHLKLRKESTPQTYEENK